MTKLNGINLSIHLLSETIFTEVVLRIKICVLIVNLLDELSCVQ